MPDFSVSTIFSAVDRISSVFSNMGRGADRFGRRSENAFNNASRSASRFGDVTKGILTAGLVQRGLEGVQEGLTSVVTGFVEFADVSTAAVLRFKDMGASAKDFDENLRLVRASARSTAMVTEKNATQAAQALDFLARAGFSSVEAFGSLNSMINLSTATGEEFAEVADYSTDLLGAFGLSVDNSAQKIKNLNRLNNVLAVTANSANVTVEDMFETMKVGAPIAAKYGALLEDVAAMTAVMGDAGIKGTTGATALKNIFIRLSAPTADVMKGLSRIGILQKDLVDKSGNMKPVISTFELIGKKLSTVGTAEQLGTIKDIFGAYAIAGGINLVDAIQKVDVFSDRLNNSTGIMDRIATMMRGSLGNVIRALGSALTELGFKFLTAFEKRGVVAIERITIAVRNFDIEPIIRGAELAVSIFSTMYNIIKPLVPIFPILAAGVIVYNAALAAQIALGYVSFFIRMVQTLRMATIAQLALNTMMSANPIGAVITGVTLLIAGVVLLYKNWDKVTAVFRTGLDFILDKVNKIHTVVAKFSGGFLAKIGKGVGGTIQSVVDKIKGDVKEIDNTVSNIGANIPVPGIGENVQKFVTEVNQQKANRPDNRTAPNESDVRSSRNKIDFNGQLQISGAGPGSTINSVTTGASPIRMELLGENL